MVILFLLLFIKMIINKIFIPSIDIHYNEIKKKNIKKALMRGFEPLTCRLTAYRSAN